MYIHNKYLDFYITRGCSDDLFIKFAYNYESLTNYISFKQKAQDKDIRIFIKLVKQGLKNKTVYKLLK